MVSSTVKVIKNTAPQLLDMSNNWGAVHERFTFDLVDITFFEVTTAYF